MMKNGKLFSKLSLIDLLVILLIVLILVVAVVRLGLFSTPEEAQEQIQPVTYETVECNLQARYTISATMQGEPFTVGEKVYIATKQLGVIEKIEREPATTRVTLEDGSIVTTERQDAYNYIVTIKTKLTKKNGMLYFYEVPVNVGSGLTLISHYYSGKAYVIGVEKIQ